MEISLFPLLLCLCIHHGSAKRNGEGEAAPPHRREGGAEGHRGGDSGVQPSPPLFSLENRGSLVAQGSVGHLVYRVSTEEVYRAVTLIKSAAHGWTAGTVTRRPELAALCSRIDSLWAGLGRDLRSLPGSSGRTGGAAASGRSARDLTGVAGVIGGVLNFFGLQFINHKQEHDREAIRSTVKEVEVLREDMMTNDRNIHIVAKEMKKAEKISSLNFGLDIIEEEFHLVEAPVRAIRNIIATLPQHRLSPSVEELVDTRRVWEEFVAQQRRAGWTVGAENYYDMFQLPASFWFSPGEIIVAVHVPLHRETAAKFDLFRLRPLPMLQGETIYDVQTSDEVLALDRGAASHQVWREDELRRCTQFGETYYCTNPSVTYARGSSGCLMHIWRQDATEILKHCAFTARAPGFEAHGVNDTHFLTLSPTSMPMQVQCGQRISKTMDLQGQQLVWIREGCMAVTSHYTLRAPLVQESSSKTVIIKQNLTFDDLKFNDSSAFNLERPKRIESQQEKILDILRDDDGFNFVTLIAIIAAVTAVCIVCIFIIVLYIRVRTGLKTTRGLEGKLKSEA